MNATAQKIWYVYLLCNPDTQIPFYVGKGTGERINMHERSLDCSYEPNKRKKKIICKLLSEGKQVLKKKIAEFSDERDAYIYEWAMINLYHEHIVNIRPGGSSPYSSRHELVEDQLEAVEEPSEREKSILPLIIYSLDEVAKLLRVSKRTLLREVDAGKLEAFKVGKSLRFTREAVEEYIRKQRVQPGEKLDDDESEDAA